MKFKLLAVAALMAAAAPSFAAIDGATSGNGSLMVNFITSTGAATSGGDDMSAVFDLGVDMNTVLGWNGVAGFTRTWNLSTGFVSGTGIAGNQAIGAYGSSWNDLLSFAGPSKVATIEFNVIALDNTNKADNAGGSRYLTTAGTVSSFPSLTNTNLNGFDGMDAYVTANNGRGTHNTAANGASTAQPTDAANSYFKAVGGATQGDSWLAKTTVDTTKAVTTAQNFYFLTTTAPGGNTQSAKTAFGYDLNNNGSIGTGEFAQWTVNAAAGTISFTSPVPEAETYAMLLAGLGLMGAVIRRRNRKV